MGYGSTPSSGSGSVPSGDGSYGGVPSVDPPGGTGSIPIVPSAGGIPTVPSSGGIPSTGGSIPTVPYSPCLWWYFSRSMQLQVMLSDVSDVVQLMSSMQLLGGSCHLLA